MTSMITPPKKVMRPNKVAASSDDSLDLCDCGDGDDDDIDGGGLLTILSLLLLFLYFFSVLFVYLIFLQVVQSFDFAIPNP